MADDTVAARDADPSTTPLFEPQTCWPLDLDGTRAAVPAGEVLRFAELALRVALGARTVVELLEQDECMKDCEGGPGLMSNAARGNLTYLVRASLGMLYDEAERSGERWHRMCSDPARPAAHTAR